MDDLIKKANILTEEALPYMQKFRNKVVVIKYGGNAMLNNSLKKSVMKDIVLLRHVGILPVVVHGGGPFINDEMKKEGLKPRFVHGLRVTDKPTITIIEKVFSKINKEIIKNIQRSGGKAVSVDDAITAEQKNDSLGLVGKVVKVNKEDIEEQLNKGNIPVISPLGKGKNNDIYNINADDAATKLAIGLKAEKLTIMTNVNGVIENKKLIPHLSINDAHKHIKNKVITEGMIPKVKACVEAVEAGCKKAHLINGTISHALLLEIFTDQGIGTEIVKNGS
ncbi:acetylglutamate kinase [Candidatus Woesearchaeota archaeon]|nr:acetylglutamate kinase [Candidatus Woesearchaeota archaeon]